MRIVGAPGEVDALGILNGRLFVPSVIELIDVMTIVIIDDDQDEIDFMKAAVEACYPLSVCMPFTECDKALAALTTMAAPPDYIFLDVNMKKIDGEECLREIRTHNQLSGARIVMMSSSMRIYDQKRARLIHMGAYAIAEKPDSLDEYGKMFAAVIGVIS